MKNYVLFRRCLRMLFLALSVIVLSVLVAAIEFREVTKRPSFSVESGFYEDAFYLELAAPEGCSIYYTLDSSDPDKNSILYTGPIYIDDASLNENVYSMTEGMTVQEWAVLPDFLVDKCTVVRAVAISNSVWKNQVSEVVTKSYFVGSSAEDFDGCGVVSLVTDPDNLFDTKKGIYVAGDEYTQYLATKDESEELSWAYRPANYRGRGLEWEREANITFWDAEGNQLLQKDIGIRIQGGWSRAYVPRSLNLFARKTYDGADSFEYDFFGTSLELASMTLSAGGTGHITRMNDYLLSNTIDDPTYGMMSFKPYVMFLDGEYWGFYWLTEKYDATYIQQAYGLDPSDDIVIIKARELEEGYDEDLSLYKQMVNFFKNHDMSQEENYQRACELIDMESFVDYYATMVYIGRMKDWPNYNESLWRTRTVSDEPYADGKWRWLMFDCNSYCMTSNLIEHDTLQLVLDESDIFASLWNNQTFQVNFQMRLMEIADECFNGDEMSQLIDNYKITMTPALEKTWGRFFGKDSEMPTKFESGTNSVKKFYSQRREIVNSWFD